MRTGGRGVNNIGASAEARFHGSKSKGTLLDSAMYQSCNRYISALSAKSINNLEVTLVQNCY